MVTKSLLLIIGLFLFGFAGAQVMQDDFNDGNFTSNPAWAGNDTKFQVLTGQLNSTSIIANDTFYLSTPSTAALNAEWNFLINLQFNTSSLNYVDFFVMADNPDLRVASGYFVRIGGTNDEISLFKKNGSTITQIINGVNNSTNKSLNTIQIRLLRSSAGEFTLLRDTAGGTNYFNEGTVIDNQFTSSLFAGYLIRQSTSSFFGRHFLDDVYAGPIILDTNPPVIQQVQIISPVEIDVLFNENLEQTSAEDIAHYSINNGIGQPLTAELNAIDKKLVKLTLFNSLINGQSYTLTVNGVQDVSANATLNAVFNFNFLVSANPVFKDIIINEFMPDPSPPIALPEKEFIEIYNKSNKIFNLQGWKLSDASSTTSLKNYFLYPGNYLILCANADTSEFKSFGPTMGLSSWPSLNNTGDEIKLSTASDFIVDQLKFDLSWYRDTEKDDGGFSLELINPVSPCSAASNWTASASFDGGTPGTQNSVFSTQLDQVPPQLVAATKSGADTLLLTFSEPMDSLSLLAGNYSMNNGITALQIKVLDNSATQVTLQLSQALLPGVSYQITVTGVKDCIGNFIGPQNTLAFGEGVQPLPGEIIITEVYPIPVDNNQLPNFEFFEIYNVSNKLIDLNNTTISDLTSSTRFVNRIISPGEYVIVSSSTAVPFFSPFGKVFSVSSFISLNSDGDRIELRNPAGEIVNEVNYTKAWYGDDSKANGGWSIELVDLENPCAGFGAWKASVSEIGATPGYLNSVNGDFLDNLQPDVIEILAEDSNTVTITFNENIAYQKFGLPAIQISDGIGIDTLYFLDELNAVLKLTQNLQFNKIYKVLIDSAFDCFGNKISIKNLDLVLPFVPQAGQIIINEILFNPVTGGSDFVELYNHSDVHLSLKNIFLANWDSEIGQSSSLKPLGNKNRFIAPGEYIVLTNNKGNIESVYPNSIGKKFIQLSSLPAYNDSEGSVILLLSDSAISERFDYTDDLHFPLLDDKNGVSLERLDFNRPVNDPENWHSASANENYATPGYRNSQSSSAEYENNAVTVNPKIFSPDQDGYQDVLNINYTFDSPGKIANITILNSNGQIVKFLINNTLLGLQGTFVWDGLNEDNRRVQSGIYVVVFETFDANGNTKIFKTSCVVADRFR